MARLNLFRHLPSRLQGHKDVSLIEQPSTFFFIPTYCDILEFSSAVPSESFDRRRGLQSPVALKVSHPVEQPRSGLDGEFIAQPVGHI